DRRGIRRRDDREFDVTRLDQLQKLRLLPELGAGILVDDHRPLEFLELGGEHVVSDAVAGIELLIVSEAVVLYVLGGRTRTEKNCRRSKRAKKPRHVSHDPSSPFPYRFAGSNHQRRKIVNNASPDRDVLHQSETATPKIIYNHAAD